MLHRLFTGRITLYGSLGSIRSTIYQVLYFLFFSNTAKETSTYLLTGQRGVCCWDNERPIFGSFFRPVSHGPAGLFTFGPVLDPLLLIA
jgi:hypothetical protein